MYTIIKTNYEGSPIIQEVDGVSMYVQNLTIVVTNGKLTQAFPHSFSMSMTENISNLANVVQLIENDVESWFQNNFKD